ncbi:hypothetical protein [Segatella copri]|uniref:Uncharacterized protein n=1 Tax=Segatella copri DSM 18205 TaxID=537011 RepID=D1PHT3_9BACT|nr:hypothetical protein [Segatella copri]EFB33732.1 hypothetical protein PREVCOP_06803 [Segatella copri DSM 18205]MCW4096618.1 hypothetical protein [Segatella copri]MQP21229.1 hypothetical protein [Segatella copri DSM 18205]UEA43868.1 hypothetical protein LK433_04695 [Segatella copri DSM 18205]UWP51518.1 hypothetical protein NQ544_09335 [Segatella copri DSM 18205]
MKYVQLGAFTFLLMPILILLMAGMSWVLKLEIFCYIFPISLVICLGLSLAYSKAKGCIVKLFPCCVILGLTLIALFCYLLKDPAFDSNWYHQPGIYLLSHGWNPIYEHHSMKLVDESSRMWVDHYAKGQETICASIVAFTGNMEMGKLGNFFLPLSSLFFTILALSKVFEDWSKKKVGILAFVIAFPPVIWNQVLSYYIDFNLYSIVLIAFCSMILYREDKVKFLTIFVCLLALAISVKFNMLMWFGLLYLSFIVYFWKQGKRGMVGKIVSYGIGATIVSILTFSFNPYITNTMDHHSPVYPLMGGQANVDIMSIVEPESFDKYNNLEKILVADFSRPTTGSQSQVYQFPYGGYPLKNLTACGSVDAKLGGAGLFWIDALLLALLVFGFARGHKTKRGKGMIALSLAFFATQFLVPGGWFYRYVSYIYLVPILLLMATEGKLLGKNIVRLRKLTYGLLLINCLVAMGATLATTIVANQIEDYYVKCINHSDKSCYSSDLYGFVRKIEPAKRILGLSKPSNTMEQIPLLPTRVRIYIDYSALNRDVKTNFIQELLLKKGVLK